MPFRYKIKCINTLNYVVFERFSNWELFHHLIFKVKLFLNKNEFPPCTSNEKIKLLLDEKVEDKRSIITTKQQVTSSYPFYVTSPVVSIKHSPKVSIFL